MKQATYVREQYPDAEIYIFYIDIRATDRLEAFYTKVKEDDKIHFFKGKVAKITPDDSGKGLILRVEDTTTEALREMPADLVVLATGMQPNTSDTPLPITAHYDDYGFLTSNDQQGGILGAGCSKAPMNVSETVQDGTAAALKAIQSIARR
jgi:quinone-modifying oxidoreductase subunit QmoA